MKERKIAENVSRFLSRATDLYGRVRGESLSMELWHNLSDLEMESPIEHLFWIAANVMARCEACHVNPEAVYDKTGKLVLPRGLYIQPQREIGKYRVDFYLCQIGIAPEDIYTPVIVELDGHEFHDKDKRQRSYEKARDRDLVRAGCRVLHFTGSDVCADPFKVVHEVFSLLGVMVGSGREEYDSRDPVGWGVE